MVRLPLVLVLLPSIAVAQDLISVCGSDYGDATYNCTTNPPCVTGDGCPSDKATCFALPESECRIPPTSSPTETPLKVCGLDYLGATSNCTGMPCDETGACPDKMACFTVFPSECIDAPPPDDNQTLAEDAADANSTVVVDSNSTDLYLCAASFEEAAYNCTADAACTPGGTECDMGQACFVVSLEACVDSTLDNVTETMNVTEATNLTLTDMLSLSPSVSNASIASPAAFPTLPPVQPDFLYVCGANYTDADVNSCVNSACPSGDGCDVGFTCFAIPFMDCSSDGNGTTTTALATVAAGGTTVASFTGTTVSSGNDTITTVASGNDTITTVASGLGTTTVVSSFTNASIEEDNATAPAMTGGSTTTAPVPNLLFCGESYEIAVLNCYINQPCLSSAPDECPTGQACFLIPSQCIPPLPTASPSDGSTIISTEITTALATNETNSTELAPTLAQPSLAPVSPPPTASPIVNTHFCGVNYTDAEVSCDFDTACPGGFECPSGQTCFTGIVCPATAPVVIPPTASPTLRGTAFPSTAVSIQGTTNGTTLASLNGTDAPDNATLTTEAAQAYRYCGFTPEDAADNCAINTPCPDGMADACFTGQACFELPGPCDVESPVATPIASSPPTVPATTAKPVFDPNVTSYCGIDYPDAQDNCYKNTPCPGNSNAECPNGQTCFPGIMGCEMPAVESAAPISAPDEGMNETDVPVLPGAIVPTNAPTDKPSINYDFAGFGDNAVERNDSFRAGDNCNFGVLLVSGMVGVIATILL